MKQTIPVSAVITAYNSAWCLERAVACVRGQTAAPAEIVIIDDGSTDGTLELASRMEGVRCVWKENGGAGSARNLGWREARENVIAFLDADDLWAPEKLEWQWEAFVREPDLELCLGLTQMKLEQGGEFKDCGPVRTAPNIGALLIAKRLFEQAGGFDESLKTSEDLDWVMRCRRAGAKTTVVEKVVLHYLRRPGSLSTGHNGRERDFLEAVRRAMKSRQGTGR